MRQRLFKQMVIVFGVTFLLVGCGGPATDTTDNIQVVEDGDQVAADAVVIEEVRVTSQGFVPQVITVKPGTVVRWVNDDAGRHWIASDPHPTHTNLGGFDAERAIAQGEVYEFTFKHVGEWGYHDHLRPGTFAGTVIVTQ